MTNTALVAFPKDFKQLQAQLEAWRKKGGRGRRIPVVLWRAAAEAGLEHGTAFVAKTLRLDYTKLKRQVEALKQSSKPQTEPSAPFFELPPARHVVPEQGAVFEFSSSDGSTLIVRLPPGQVSDLLPLAAQLWGRNL